VPGVVKAKATDNEESITTRTFISIRRCGSECLTREKARVGAVVEGVRRRAQARYGGLWALVLVGFGGLKVACGLYLVGSTISCGLWACGCRRQNRALQAGSRSATSHHNHSQASHPASHTLGHTRSGQSGKSTASSGNGLHPPPRPRYSKIQ
jgi:hypothetical protein